MPQPYQPHVGDVNTILRLRIMQLPVGATDTSLAVAVDLSQATSMQFVLTSPKKRRFVVLAHLTTDGSDGRLQYETVLGDLDVAGRWKIQAKWQQGSGNWSSDIAVFAVSDNL